MTTITNILETFEKLAYKFLLAILFFPKTIIKIIVDPNWAPGYIRGELKQEKNPFDEYMSPIVLLLMVALIPALIRSFLPTFDTVITAGPAKDEPANTRLLEFQAETEIRFRSPDVFNQYTWTVWKIISTDENGRPAAVNLYYRETYNEFTDKSLIKFFGDGEPISNSGTFLSLLEYKDQKLNVPTSKFYFAFDDNTKEEEPDEYLVSYEIISFYPEDITDNEGNNYFPDKVTDVFDPENTNFTLERHSASQTVYVPGTKDKNQQVLIPETKSKKGKGGGVNVSDLLKKETTTFLALGLLFPPLLFSLAIKLFNKPKNSDENVPKVQETSGNKPVESETNENVSKKQESGGNAPVQWEISENALRESFYAQCYYFSPLSLAIWATYYARYFLSPDVFNYKANDYALSLILMPALLAVFWFIGVETMVIERERDTKRWIAFLITMFCLALILLAGFTVFMFIQPGSSLPDFLRVKAILVYPWVGVVLLALAGYGWIKNRRSSGQKIAARDLILVGVSILVVYGALRLMGWIMDFASVPSSEPTMQVVTAIPQSSVQETIPVIETPVETPPSETPVPDVNRFYTEEFDGNLDAWIPFGDEDKVEKSIVDGKLIVHLSLLDGNIPTTYLYNANFNYTDVRVDIVAANDGNNTNNIILLCRYTQNGLYEFDISSSGLYSIYAVDLAGTIQKGYNELSSGSSPHIKAGLSTNAYTAVCKGSDLSLYANGELVNTVTDTTFNFVEGNIGFGVSGLQAIPVDVSFDSLTVSEP